MTIGIGRSTDAMEWERLSQVKRWLELIEAGEAYGLFDRRTHDDRDVVFRRGERATRSYVLTQGAIEIVQRSPEGQSLVVKILVAPSFFGVIEAVAGEPEYLETVRVLGSATTASLDALRFRQQCESDSLAAFECMRDMASAFCAAARFESAPMHDVEAKIANLLLSYAETVGVPDGDDVRLDIKRTQADFAEAIGGGERSVNRLFKDFKADDVVIKRNARYILRDLVGLRERAGDLANSLLS